MNDGSSIEEGEPDKVINTYNFLIARKAKGEEIRVCVSSEAEKSYGNLKVEITGVKVFNKYGEESDVLITGERCTVEIGVTAHEDMENITVGILIRDKFGQDILVPIHTTRKSPSDLIAARNVL